MLFYVYSPFFEEKWFNSACEGLCVIILSVLANVHWTAFMASHEMPFEPRLPWRGPHQSSTNAQHDESLDCSPLTRLVARHHQILVRPPVYLVMWGLPFGTSFFQQFLISSSLACPLKRTTAEGTVQELSSGVAGEARDEGGERNLFDT